MISNYDLLLPRQIVFGCGRRREIGTLAKPFGQRAILVLGSQSLVKQGFVKELIADLEAVGISILTEELIRHEPEVADVDRFVGRLKSSLLDGDFVIALGGGSAIDLGKAVAALLPQSDPAGVLDYLEGVGKGLKLKETPLPMIAMPTTAGTGSEATKNAVISSYDPPFKKSLRDDRMISALVLVDPELTVSCPAKITAESGMDAITQLFESYVSRRHQPLTDALIEQGLTLALDALPKLVDEPQNLDARSKMSHAALLSGICLANAGLGMAHGVAPALGTHCRVPHGAACALMLPITLRTNAGVCSERYGRLGRILLNLPSETPNDETTQKLIERIEKLCETVHVPRCLADLSVSEEMISALARDSKGTSMSGNPKQLTEEEIVNILKTIAR